VRGGHGARGSGTVSPDPRTLVLTWWVGGFRSTDEGSPPEATPSGLHEVGSGLTRFKRLLLALLTD